MVDHYRVKQYLKEKGFRFREVDVQRDRDGARELERRHIMGVPVVLIRSHPIIGFDEAKIDKLYRNQQIRKEGV